MYTAQLPIPLQDIVELIRTDHGELHSMLNDVFNAALSAPDDAIPREQLVQFKQLVDMLGKATAELRERKSDLSVVM